MARTPEQPPLHHRRPRARKDKRVNWPSEGGLLARLLLAKKEELPALLLSFLYYFFLLCSYSLLRPVREEMGIRSGVENLQWLFTATFFVMLMAVPLFGWCAARFPRQRLIPLTYLFFILCLIGFWCWWQTEQAIIWAARAFFVWLSVFNLFVVSVFWSLMADYFTKQQAVRLFSMIAAGGSAGAILGPAITGIAVQFVEPANLLLVSAAMLICTMPCLSGLERRQVRDRQQSMGKGAASSAATVAIGGSIFDGISAVRKSPYLLGICCFIWLYTTLATFLYFLQAEIVSQTFSTSADRTSAFAIMDFATNTLTLCLQIFITAHLVRKVGLPKVLALIPLLMIIGFCLLAMFSGFAVIAVFQIVRRAGNYGVAKPGREMLFSVVSRSEKYKSKNFIDTVVYRGGDALAGWIYAGLTALGVGTAGIAWLGAPLALLWASVGYRLGVQHSKREIGNAGDTHHGEDKRATPQSL